RYNASELPAFVINLMVENAMFQYPSLPKSVNNIQIDVHVQNATGVPDATIIDVNKFHIEMAGNPVDFNAHIKTPVSDPDIKANIQGRIDLASVKDIVPLDSGDAMSGIIK